MKHLLGCCWVDDELVWDDVEDDEVVVEAGCPATVNLVCACPLL